MRDDVGAAREVRDRCRRMCVENRAQEQPARDPGLRCFAGRIHIGEHDGVGVDERVGEVAPQPSSARVAVRLEDGHDPAPLPLPGRLEGGDDLAREMRVVIDQRHPANLAPELEAARHATEAAERTRHGVEGHAELERRRRGTRRVQRVVAAGNGELDGTEGRGSPHELEATPAATTLVAHHAVVGVLAPPVGPRPGFTGGQSCRDRIVGTDDADAGDRSEELLERGNERLEAPVVVEVVGLHVRDERGLRFELEERAVALVGLDHEPLALVEGCVRPDLVEIAADHEAGAPPGCPQTEGEHRGCGRLAVTARHCDAASCRDQRPKRVRASHDRDAACSGRFDLGIAARDRGRCDDRVERVGQVIGIVPDTGVDAEEAQPLERR